MSKQLRLCVNSEVAVIMCTYNGANFIREQILSIFNGSIIPKYIYIFDWGSSDETIDIIENFMGKSDINEIILIKKNKPIGAYHSFLQAIEYTLKLDQTTNYFFLCDQDDVWKEDKVERMLGYTNENNTYHLIFSDAYCFSDERYMCPHFNKKNNFYIKNHEVELDSSIYFANPIIGMTMMVSRTLLLDTISYKYKNVVNMHDWLIVLNCYLHGYDVKYIPMCLVDYRMHQSNLVGIQNGKISLRKIGNYKSILKNIKYRLKFLGKDHLLLEKNFRQIIFKSGFFSKRYKVKLWLLMLLHRFV